MIWAVKERDTVIVSAGAVAYMYAEEQVSLVICREVEPSTDMKEGVGEGSGRVYEDKNKTSPWVRETRIGSNKVRTTTQLHRPANDDPRKRSKRETP